MWTGTGGFLNWIRTSTTSALGRAEKSSKGCSYKLSWDFTRSSREFVAEFTTPFYPELLACSFFLIRSTESAFRLGNWQQRRVELHEGCIYGRVRGVATVTVRRLRDHL